MFLWLLSPRCCTVFFVVCISDNVLWLRNAESVKCWNLFNLLSWLKTESHFNGWEWVYVLYLKIDSWSSGCVTVSYLHPSTKSSAKEDHWHTAAHLLFKTEPHARCCDFSFYSDSLQPSIYHSIISVLESKDIPAQHRMSDGAGLTLVLFWPKLWDRIETGSTTYSSEISWINMKIVPLNLFIGQFVKYSWLGGRMAITYQVLAQLRIIN